jgi:hypothetical protein
MAKPASILAYSFACASMAAIATALADDPPARPARPFIETSYIIAPLGVGDFTLEDSEYDERNKAGGAGFRYALKGHQESRIDVFVYPAGLEAQADAIRQGMAEFKAGIQSAEQAGYYTDVRMVDEADFPLLAAPGQGAQAAEPSPATSSGDGGREAILRGLVEANVPVGRKLRMQLDMQPLGMPMHSDGFLFYKQLYFFKVRVSAARERIDGAAFQALADAAARTLVRAIEVDNIGGCLDNTIEVPADAAPDAIATLLVRRSAEMQGKNCFDSAATAGIAKKTRDARVVDIAYDPGDWKSQ